MFGKFKCIFIRYRQTLPFLSRALNIAELDADSSPALLVGTGWRWASRSITLNIHRENLSFSTAPALIYSADLPKAKNWKSNQYQINVKFSWTPRTYHI